MDQQLRESECEDNRGPRSLAVHPEDAPAPAEAIVLAAIEHLLYAHLPQSRRAHNAWLDCYIQCGSRKRVCHACGRERCVREDLVDSLQLGVPRCLCMGYLSDACGCREREGIHYAAHWSGYVRER